jgi:hypothetical protein
MIKANQENVILFRRWGSGNRVLVIVSWNGTHIYLQRAEGKNLKITLFCHHSVQESNLTLRRTVATSLQTNILVNFDHSKMNRQIHGTLKQDLEWLEISANQLVTHLWVDILSTVSFLTLIMFFNSFAPYLCLPRYFKSLLYENSELFQSSSH